MLKNLGTRVILTYSFNLGSLLGFIFVIQILSGFLIVLFYEPVFSLAFGSVQYVMFEVNFGWFFRLLHFNGASFFFLFLYLHFFKALFYSRMKLLEVWFFGLLIFVFLIMEAFLGYTLVWSQMSFWAGTVITRLLRVVPFYGKSLVFFIWGGFGLNSGTLKFFYLIHFISPFLILLLVFFHLFFLHFYGRTRDLGFSSKFISRSFFPYYWFKDFLNLLVILFFFIFLTCFPFLLGDCLGFEDVNELVSPVHIVPEWYFLWAYAILRAIPSKILGVLVLLFSILVYFLFFLSYRPVKDIFQKWLVFVFVFNVLFLTFLGGSEPLFPFVFLRQFFRFFYFLIIIFMFFLFIFLLLVIFY